MSRRARLDPPCTSRAPEGRLRLGLLFVLAGFGHAACGGLTTHDGEALAEGARGDEVGERGEHDIDQSDQDNDDPDSGPGDPSAGGTACACGASPAMLVLETASGSYEFTEPPGALLYPSFDFGCAAPGPAYVPAACNRRATIAACNEAAGCLLLTGGADGAEPQLTWYDSAGTSVTQVQGGTSELVIEVNDGSLVAGYFTFRDSDAVTYSGKFSVCPVTVRHCE